MARTIGHTHTPLYRVVQKGWPNPTDSSFSQTVDDNRWNTRDFPALYCCCSKRVARGIVMDRLERNQIALEDLSPEVSPDLAEIKWTGELVDVTSAEGLAANGFPQNYPDGVTATDCQKAAVSWHAQGLEGVVSRSVSLYRLKAESAWAGDHRAWSEVAIFTNRTRSRPTSDLRHVGLEWLLVPLATFDDA